MTDRPLDVSVPISQTTAPYQIVLADSAKPSKQYIQLNLSSASETVGSTDTVSRTLQKSLQIECIKPSSTWEWCCLQPARVLGLTCL